jgi:hypothetical protein
VMEADTEYYSISRWGKDSIETLPLGGSNACRNTSISLNFKTKEFYFITKNAGGECKALGVELEKLSKPRIAQVVDGSDIINSKFAEIQKKAFEVLAGDFRKKVQALIDKAQKAGE